MNDDKPVSYCWQFSYSISIYGAFVKLLGSE